MNNNPDRIEEGREYMLGSVIDPVPCVQREEFIIYNYAAWLDKHLAMIDGGSISCGDVPGLVCRAPNPAIHP